MNYSAFKDLRSNSTIAIGPGVQYVLFFRNTPRDAFLLRLQTQIAENRFILLLPLISNERVVAEGNHVY